MAGCSSPLGATACDVTYLCLPPITYWDLLQPPCTAFATGLTLPAELPLLCCWSLQHPSKERIMLRRRKGFVRVAVETGTSIVPVYHFGCTQVSLG